MTEDEYWQLLAEATQGVDDIEDAPGRVVERLATLPADLIRGFDEVQTRLMAKSYSWRLWGAAYLIQGGCSDDGFEYFRSWLISRGRAVFESAVEEPDSLAGFLAEGEEPELEEFMYVAGEAYEAATGEELEGAHTRYPELGAGWDFDDAGELAGRYPRLWKRFGW